MYGRADSKPHPNDLPIYAQNSLKLNSIRSNISGRSEVKSDQSFGPCKVCSVIKLNHCKGLQNLLVRNNEAALRDSTHGRIYLSKVNKLTR